LLLTTDCFAGSAVGDSCRPSWQVSAFRMLLESPHSDAAFKDLLARARLPGQLYGLCGLYFTDPVSFRVVLEKYARMDAEVDEQLGGCIVFTVAVSRIARRSSPNVVRTTSPGDAIEGWNRRDGWNPDDGPDETGAVDIAAGGIPRDFCLTAKDIEKRWPLDAVPREERQASFWMEQLEHGDAEAALGGFWRLGPRAVPELLVALGHDSPDVRARAADVVARMGPGVLLGGSREAGKRLGALLADPHTAVRVAAVDGLRSLGPWAIDALPEIRKAHAAAKRQGPDDAFDGDLGDFLGLLVWLGSKAVPRLTNLLGHADEHVRVQALRMLGELGEDAAPAIPRVLETVADPDLGVRTCAVWTLGRIGQATESVLAALRAARHDDAIVLRFHAALVLWKMRREAERGTCDILIEGIAYPADDAFGAFLEPDSIEEATVAVVEMGKSRGDCVEGLKLALEEGARDARSKAARLLGEVGPRGAVAVPALKLLLEDNESCVRLAAVGALGAMGPTARPALPGVIGLLNDPESRVRSAAREAVANIRGEHPPEASRPPEGRIR
jgi:HEAT repeat protein